MRRTDVLRRWAARFLRGLCVTAGGFLFSVVLAGVAHAGTSAPEPQPGAATEQNLSEVRHDSAGGDDRAVSIRRLRTAVERVAASAKPGRPAAEKMPNHHPWV